MHRSFRYSDIIFGSHIIRLHGRVTREFPGEENLIARHPFDNTISSCDTVGFTVGFCAGALPYFKFISDCLREVY